MIFYAISLLIANLSIMSVSPLVRAALAAFFVGACACGSAIAVMPTDTPANGSIQSLAPLPTVTVTAMASPSATPMPTFTPYPTLTPYPTYTPQPIATVIPGTCVPLFDTQYPCEQH